MLSTWLLRHVSLCLFSELSVWGVTSVNAEKEQHFPGANERSKELHNLVQSVFTENAKRQSLHVFAYENKHAVGLHIHLGFIVSQSRWPQPRLKIHFSFLLCLWLDQIPP